MRGRVRKLAHPVYMAQVLEIAYPLPPWLPSPIMRRGFAAMARVTQRLQVLRRIGATLRARHNMIHIGSWHILTSVHTKRVNTRRVAPQYHEPQPLPVAPVTAG